MHVRTVLFATVLCALLVSGAAVAFAQPAASPDDLNWIGPDDGKSYSEVTGASLWWYQDLHDDEAKLEGSYSAFEGTATVTLYADGEVVSSQVNDVYLDNPHGGYDSTSNKCKVCHAVHRAEGAYYLMRANNQDDACDYCHIGGSARSRLVVYDSTTAGKFATNGHTIGASSIIPDSSVQQELVEVDLETIAADMSTKEDTVLVRRYMERRNQLFRFARSHGHVPAHMNGQNTISRVGPTALRCMSCHQPHNAEDLVWKPKGATGAGGDPTGYKLLRSSPSGSVLGRGANAAAIDAAMQNRQAIDELPFNAVVKVPESEFLTAGNTGPDAGGHGYGTIWTEWTGPAAGAYGAKDAGQNPSYIGSPAAMSVWCADCHNLNVGYYRDVDAEFGGKSHADRTHPAPYVGAETNGIATGPGQCYSCHRADMPTEAGSCNQCHLGPNRYAEMRAEAVSQNQYALYDFPHAGTDTNEKLLGGWTAELSASGDMVVTETTVTADKLDGVCLRCHTGIGKRH